MDFVTLIGKEQNTEAYAELQNMLSQKVSDVLDAKKHEIAASLFGGDVSVSQEQEQEEQE
jgi:hypothetical protein